MHKGKYTTLTPDAGDLSGSGFWIGEEQCSLAYGAGLSSSVFLHNLVYLYSRLEGPKSSSIEFYLHHFTTKSAYQQLATRINSISN